MYNEICKFYDFAMPFRNISKFSIVCKYCTIHLLLKTNVYFPTSLYFYAQARYSDAIRLHAYVKY